MKDFTAVSLLACGDERDRRAAGLTPEERAGHHPHGEGKAGLADFLFVGLCILHHLAGEVLKRMTGTDMIHVPFKGAGPALVALAGNEVTFGFTSMPSAMPLITAKRIRPLAVTGEKHLSALPGIPTMTEAGVPPPPGLDIREWAAWR